MAIFDASLMYEQNFRRFDDFFLENTVSASLAQSVCGIMKNLLSSKNISSNHLFSNFFSKNFTLT